MKSPDLPLVAFKLDGQDVHAVDLKTGDAETFAALVKPVFR